MNLNYFIKRVLLTAFLYALMGNITYSKDRAQNPSVVKILKTKEGYQLLRNGKPYFVKGAGGSKHLEQLVKSGGNSIRTWGADNQKDLLDRAHSLGLSVTMGFWLGHERHGFNYNDPKAVAAQLEACKKAVAKYKDHPALLMWAVGNEMEGDGTNDAIWKAVNDIAKACKELDPNHPTITITAELGKNNLKVRKIHQLCPDIDIAGFNSYGGAASIPERYAEAGGTKPYMITEFGPLGHWEAGKNSRGVPYEMTSTEKADFYAASYNQGVLGSPLCVGSYVFLWGAKQEATATWVGMFLSDGTRLGAVDAMTEVWGGKKPLNRCPVVMKLRLEKNTGLKPGDTLGAKVEVKDPDGDPLRVSWVLRREASNYNTGGDYQQGESEFPDALISSDTTSAEIIIPESGGGYRLFVYVFDDQGGGAVANVPLHVEGKVMPLPLPRPELPFVIYGEGLLDSAPYHPSGYMGNISAIKMELDSDEAPYKGRQCIKVTYKASDNWAGVIWQSPPNDWGKLAGGYNLSEASELEFYVRGEKGREVISFGVGAIAGDQAFPDSCKVVVEKLSLSTEWQKIRIALDGRDRSAIKSGFLWTLVGQQHPVTFYLDEIRFVKDSN